MENEERENDTLVRGPEDESVVRLPVSDAQAAAIAEVYGLPLSREPMETLQMLAEHANRLVNDTPEELPGFIVVQLEAVAEWLALVDGTLVQNRMRLDVEERRADVAKVFKA
jgi:hypothetical protein